MKRRRYIIAILFILALVGLFGIVFVSGSFAPVGLCFILAATSLGGVMTIYEGYLIYQSEYRFFLRAFSRPKKLEQVGSVAKRAGALFMVQGFCFGLLAVSALVYIVRSR